MGELSKYGKFIGIAAIVLVVLAFTPIGGFVAQVAMLATIGLAIWLAIRLLQIGNWRDKPYWEINGFIGIYIAIFAGLTLFLAYLNPPMPNYHTGPCRVSRYESC